MRDARAFGWHAPDLDRKAGRLRWPRIRSKAGGHGLRTFAYVILGLLAMPQSAFPETPLAGRLAADPAKLEGPNLRVAWRGARTETALTVPSRPQARPFVAEGPLAARLSDPLARPQARPAAAMFRPRVRPGD